FRTRSASRRCGEVAERQHAAGGDAGVGSDGAGGSFGGQASMRARPMVRRAAVRVADRGAGAAARVSRIDQIGWHKDYGAWAVRAGRIRAGAPVERMAV